ncbi:MAG: hypothetical protein KDA85_16650 [Planctomycetaceae bacterium]|nr:hypothetical protein [Planctomycetaceae bacterium]
MNTILASVSVCAFLLSPRPWQEINATGETADSAIVSSPEAPAVRVNRDLWQIEFPADATFSPESIRRGLALDRSFGHASHDPSVSDVEFTELLERRVTAGLRQAGFLHALVHVEVDAVTGGLTVQITEGTRYRNGKICISGLTPVDEAEVRAALVPPFARQGTHDVWATGAFTQFSEARVSQLRKKVATALVRCGHPFAAFDVRIVQDDETQTGLLEVDVHELSAGQPVESFRVTGLQRHTPEQVLEFLQLTAGMSYNAELRDRITRELLGSGRFLVADVWAEYAFAEDQPVPVNIEVREYDLAPLLNEPLSDAHQAAVQFASWLSAWHQRDADLLIRVVLDAKSEVVESEVVESGAPQRLANLAGSAPASDATQPAQSVRNMLDGCLQAIGYRLPSRPVTVELVTSPHSGTLLTIFDNTSIETTVPEKQNRVATVFVSAEHVGVISWQRNIRWTSDSVPFELGQQILLHGLPANPEGRRFNFFYGYGIHTADTASLRTELDVAPAFLMDLAQGADGQTRFECADGRNRFSGDWGVLEADAGTGRLLSVSADYDGVHLRIETGEKLVEESLQRLATECADIPEMHREGHSVSSFTQFLANAVLPAPAELADRPAADQDSLQVTQDDASKQRRRIIHLVSQLLRNTEAVDAIAQRVQRLFDRSILVIPVAQDEEQLAGVDLPFALHLLTAGCAEGSAPHQLGHYAWRQQTPDGKADFDAFLRRTFQDPPGPVSLLLMGKAFSGMGSACAHFGQKKLATTDFERDISQLIATPCLLRDVVFAAIQSIQSMSDEEAELLAICTESVLRDDDGSPVNLRPLLVLIRSQRGESPESVVKLILPVVWQGGMRSYVERQLRSMIPTQQSKQITPVSATKTEPASPLGKPEGQVKKGPTMLEVLRPLELPSASDSVFTPQNTILFEKPRASK